MPKLGPLFVMAAIAVFYFSPPLGAWSPHRSDENPASSFTPLSRLRPETVPELKRGPQTMVLTQAPVAAPLVAPLREPAVLPHLEPSLRENAIHRGQDLSKLAQAMFQKTGVDPALAQLSVPPALLTVLKDVARLSAQPIQNDAEFTRLEPVLNNLLHADGLHVRFLIARTDQRAPEGKLAMTVHRITAVFKMDVKGTAINIYEARQIDSTGLSEELIGEHDGVSPFAIMFAGSVDQVEKNYRDLQAGRTLWAFREMAGGPFVRYFSSRNIDVARAVEGAVKTGLDQFKLGELRQALNLWVASHEASHVYFALQDGAKLVSAQSPQAPVLDLNEARAYLHELAHADLRLIKADLADILRIALSDPGNVNKNGSKRAVELLHRQLPNSKLMTLTTIGFPVLDINIRALPDIFRTDPVVIQQAAQKALAAFDEKYGFR